FADLKAGLEACLAAVRGHGRPDVTVLTGGVGWVPPAAQAGGGGGGGGGGPPPPPAPPGAPLSPRPRPPPAPPPPPAGRRGRPPPPRVGGCSQGPGPARRPPRR